MRFVAEFANQPLHVGDAHPKGRAGLRNDILLDHDAAQIVRAIFQRDLADFLSLRHPGALDVGKIIEINPAQRLRAQIFVRPTVGAFSSCARPGRSSR